MAILTSLVVESAWALPETVASASILKQPGTSGQHFPNRVEIELHTDPANLCVSVNFSIPLYSNGYRVWHEATDAGGEVDVAVIELDRAALPSTMLYAAFTPSNLP